MTNSKVGWENRVRSYFRKAREGHSGEIPFQHIWVTWESKPWKIWGNGIAGREKSKAKPRAGEACLVHLNNSREASVAAVQGRKGNLISFHLTSGQAGPSASWLTPKSMLIPLYLVIYYNNLIRSHWGWKKSIGRYVSESISYSYISALPSPFFHHLREKGQGLEAYTIWL